MLHAISRIPTNNTPSTYNQPNNKPLLFEPLSTTREKSSRLKSPLAGGFTEKPNTRSKPGCRVYAIAHPQIYRISVRSSSTLEGVLSSRLVVRLHACVPSVLVSRRVSLSIYTRSARLSVFSSCLPFLSPRLLLSLRTRAKRV